MILKILLLLVLITLLAYIITVAFVTFSDPKAKENEDYLVIISKEKHPQKASITKKEVAYSDPEKMKSSTMSRK